MKIILSLALASVFFLLVNKGSFAQVNNSPFSSLQKNFLLQTPAGKTLEQRIVIKSNSSDRQTINFNWQGYILNSNEQVSPTALTSHSIDFATFPQESVPIEPFGVINIPVTLTLPETLKPGDYYGSLILIGESYQEKSNFTVRVLGQLKEDIYVKSFNDDGKFTTLELENLGNRTSKVTLSLTISGLLTKELTSSSQFELKAGERKIIKQPHQKLLPGYYQIKVTNSFGDKNTTVTKLYSFWIRSEFYLFSAVTFLAVFIIFFSVRKTYHNV